jgi:hypothetical protein
MARYARSIRALGGIANRDDKAYIYEATSDSKMDSDLTKDSKSFAASEVAELLRGIEEHLATA